MSPKRSHIRSFTLLVLALAASQMACSSGESADAPPADELEAQAVAAEGVQRAAAPQGGARNQAPRDAVVPRATVPQGSSLTFVVTEAVAAGTHPVGHVFAATLASAVIGLDGRVALPEGTAGRWVVTESTADDGEGQALLAVRLEAVQLGGRWHPVRATVTEADLAVDARDSKQETAAKIGVGAVAGAVAGRIIGGGSRSAVKGAAVGAAMGTVVALATRGGTAELRAGSRITVTLDDQLDLEG